VVGEGRARASRSTASWMAAAAWKHTTGSGHVSGTPQGATQRGGGGRITGIADEWRDMTWAPQASLTSGGTWLRHPKLRSGGRRVSN